MFSRKQILSAMAGVAMLTMPVSAFAGHHDGDRDDRRPFAWHDQGFHRGWEKHQIAPMGPRYGGGYDEDRRTPARGWYGRPTSRPYGYHRECDEDGDRCGWEANAPQRFYRPYAAPNYRYAPGYWNEDENEDEGGSYSWYQQMPPSSYNGSQRMGWLVDRRQRALYAIARLRARHDSRGAARMVKVLNGLNQRIAVVNNPRLGYSGGYGYNSGYGYAPTMNNYFDPANSLGSALPYNGSYYGSPYGSSYYGSPYSNGSYYGNPTVDALSSLVVPLLGGIR
jgi:hypothetical protein